jgi:hypothetical protein
MLYLIQLIIVYFQKIKILGLELQFMQEKSQDFK